jgi:Tol biopolymer transport system component
MLAISLPIAAFVVVFGVSLVLLSRDPAPRAAAAPRPAAASGRLVTSVEQAEGGFVKATLVAMSVDGSHAEAVTSQPDGDLGVYDASPAISPDGETVAFWRVPEPRNPQEQAKPRVYLIGMDGTDPHRLTEGPSLEIQPAWAPDGQQLVLARQVGRQFDLFTAALDGSLGTRVTHSKGADAVEPSWSPDGQTILYTRMEDEHGDLWTVNADGTGAQPLLEGEHDDTTPAWSPDGTQIAFVRDGHVAVAAADGSDVQLLTGADASNDWRPGWSPDGERIIFSREPGQIFVVDSDGRNLTPVKTGAPAAGAVWEPAE